jgi:hypothetical protein
MEAMMEARRPSAKQPTARAPKTATARASGIDFPISKAAIATALTKKTGTAIHSAGRGNRWRFAARISDSVKENTSGQSRPILVSNSFRNCENTA